MMLLKMESQEQAQKTASAEDYGAKDIEVMEDLNAVRKRPAMYIGSTDSKGLHHLVYEVVDNSIDEALAGFCNRIVIIINKDGSMTVEVKRNRKIYTQSYEKGKTASQLKIIGDAGENETGTKVTFYPDGEIFETLEFSFDVLSARLRELAFLNKGIHIILKDERSDKSIDFSYSGGIVSFVEYVNKNRQTLHKPVYCNKEKNNISVEFCIQYNDGYQENVFSF